MNVFPKFWELFHSEVQPHGTEHMPLTQKNPGLWVDSLDRI